MRIAGNLAVMGLRRAVWGGVGLGEWGQKHLRQMFDTTNVRHYKFSTLLWLEFRTQNLICEYGFGFGIVQETSRDFVTIDMVLHQIDAVANG